MLLFLVCGALVATSGVPAQTIEDRREACFRAAFEKYYLANVEILGSRPLVASEARLQQRQLQEAYCTLFAPCSITGMDLGSAEIPYFEAFSSCLEREANEGLDADGQIHAQATGGPAVASQGCWRSPIHTPCEGPQ
jgi:hypothetical protein